VRIVGIATIKTRKEEIEEEQDSRREEMGVVEGGRRDKRGRGRGQTCFLT
jgi:hypothetical protein